MNGMFNEFSYLIYMLVFTFIPIGILWTRYHRFLWLNKKIIIYTTIFGIIYSFITEPFAASWRVWFFSESKVLGLWIFNFPIEESIFFMLISVAISSAVLVFIRHFGKRKET